MMMRGFLTALLLLVGLIVVAQPSGYYDDAAGLSGEDLRQALHDIIDDHTVVSYDYLKTAYRTTDKKSNGKLWDMYSDVPGGTPPYEYTFGTKECGNYGGEGDCHNREHSFPKSWFGGKVSPMNSDIFHVVPSDGYVNGRRSSFPFGETSNATWTSLNGSKTGPCSVSGYSGTIFEPIDEYKGDFARIYFYMATRYYGEDSNWPGSAMVDGSQLKPWALAMMLQWHEDDPVSQKEIDRNNNIYNYVQDNRNPYVDYPEYVYAVYGGGSGTVDLVAPEVDQLTVISSSELKVWFSEGLKKSSAENTGFYYIKSSQIKNAVYDESNHTVNLTISELASGSQKITINGVEDLAGNSLELVEIDFNVNSVGVCALSKEAFSIYPNPSTGNFIIECTNYESSSIGLEVYDLSGRKVDVISSYTNSTIVVESSLKTGLYLLHLSAEDAAPLVFPVIID